VKPFLKKRRKNAHKGDFGHLFIIAGSIGYPGAATLCSQAALLSGSGLVTLGIPKSIYPIVARKVTEVIPFPLPEGSEKSLSERALGPILKKMEDVDVMVVGPGLTQHRETVKLVHRLLPKLTKPTVIDADGLNAISKKVEILKRVKIPLILTPHPGEMARLIKRGSAYVQAHREEVAKKFAVRYNVTIVLKGHRSIVASPLRKRYINSTGNPGMATAGCGDVLTGVIGSLLGQKMSPFDAARYGTYLHGISGDLAVKVKGEASLIASDLLAYLPKACKKVTRL